MIGSELAYTLITKGAGVWAYLRQGTVRWGWVRQLSVGSIPGVLEGSLLVTRVQPPPQVLRYWVAGAVLAVAVLAIGLEYARHLPSRWLQILERPGPWLLPAVGVVIGLVVGATSVGSGSLSNLALILFTSGAGGEVVASGVAHTILITGVATLVYWEHNAIDVSLVLRLSAGSLPGVWIGSRVAYLLPGRFLRAFSVAMVVVSGLVLLQ